MANTGCIRIKGNPNIHEYYSNGNAVTDYYAGDLVLLDTNGRLAVAATGAASGTAGVFGIAMKQAVANSTTKIPVDVIYDDDSEFVMVYAGTTTESTIGQSFVVTFTAGSQQVSTTSGTDDVYVVDLDPRDGAKVNGRVIVKFVSTHLQNHADI